MNKGQKSFFNTRVLLFQIFLYIFAALIVLRLFVISVSQHGYYNALAENQHGYFQKLEAKRGEIFITDKYSDKPYTVATNVDQDMAYAVPREVKNPEEVSKTLSEILKLDQKEILAKISDSKKQYVPLMHQLTDEQSNAVTSAKLAGIYLEPESIRYYPEGDFLSQVLGYVGYSDNSDQKTGLYGLERTLNKDLQGKAGSIATEADLRGNWITGSARDLNPAQDGTSYVLTIDRSIQFKAESVLKDAVQKHGADSGNVIVADPKTGAILAMANYPTFNPNEYNKVKDPSVFINSATMESFEPGSTMKSVTLSSGMDSGLISPDSTFNDPGVVEIAGYKIQNSDNKSHGTVNMMYVIDHSLNTGAIYVEDLLGNDRFNNYVKKFGFGKPTGIELQEAAGNISNLKGNIQVNYYTASFGQGITVSPIQMLQAYQTMANGGKMMQPYIIAKKIYPSGKEDDTQPKEVNQVISARAASLMSAMLVDDVENGYGKAAGVKGYYIGGKTGTAQVAKGGVYVQNDNIGSFAGYGPIEDPRFVMIVNINHPRDVKFAETTAAPAFGEIASFILNYYQIPPTRK